MSFARVGVVMVSGPPLPDGWENLAALQGQLRALDRGEAIEGDPLVSSPAVRVRLAAREVAASIAAEREERHQRAWVSLRTRMDRIVDEARAARDSVPVGFESVRRGGVVVYWSPVAVLGFRAWAVKRHLTGVYGVWAEPSYRAGCHTRGGERFDPEVPHTDGRCGNPPCGIYAYKDPGSLIAEVGPIAGQQRVAFGLVAMTGKVVEHTRGYRASHVRVLAMAVAGRGRLVEVEGEEWLRRLFDDPEPALDAFEAMDPSCVEYGNSFDMSGRVAGYLDYVWLTSGGAGDG